MNSKKVPEIFKNLYAKIKSLKDTNSPYFWGAVALIGIILLALTANYLIKSMTPTLPSQTAAFPTILPTSADASRMMAPTQTAAPTLTPVPTSTIAPSNLWQVTKFLEPIKGALVVEFTNVTTGETKKGLCQSPRDPEPALGDIFIAEIKGDYILLSPTISGTGNIDLNSKTQRFIFIP